MLFRSVAIAAVAVGSASAQETILGVYVLSRHGDRTAKSTPPANLTDLGYEEVFTSGTYYRNRYIASDASSRIYGINSDIVRQSQIAASAPLDTVLQNSATGFLQGLYPPAGSQSILRNGTSVKSPLNGYQLIPLAQVSTGAGSEDQAWLQGSTNCANAQISSNNFFTSDFYMQTKNSSQPLYDSIAPMVNATFPASSVTYKNAYVIWDLLNVASIHNSTQQNNLAEYTPNTADQLRYLADSHEWNLAYNASEPIRAVTGSILAAEVLQALNNTISSKGKIKLNVQFGAYAGFQSYFGLANLTIKDSQFFGVPDYTSSMVWELVTNASLANGSWPTNDQIGVRFLFHNGTTSNISEPQAFPLFGGSSDVISWNDFVTSTNKFAIGDQKSWCLACGNSTGVCAAYANNSSGGSASGSSSSGSRPSNKSGGGMSLAVAGVIGAFVTLAVVLGIESLILLIGGFRLVGKKKLSGATRSEESSPTGSHMKA